MYPWIIYSHQDCRLIIYLDLGYPFKIWQKLEQLEELRMFTITLEYSRPTGGALMELHQRGRYVNINFKKTLSTQDHFLTTLDLLLRSWSIYFNYIFFYVAWILATQIWHIMKVSIYISLVSPSSTNSLIVNGRIFLTLLGKKNWNKTII